MKRWRLLLLWEMPLHPPAKCLSWRRLSGAVRAGCLIHSLSARRQNVCALSETSQGIIRVDVVRSRVWIPTDDSSIKKKIKNLVLSSDIRSVKAFLVMDAWHEGAEAWLHRVLLYYYKKWHCSACLFCHDRKWDLSPACLFFWAARGWQLLWEGNAPPCFA